MKLDRRKFIKLSAASVATIGLGGIGYSFAARQKVEVSRVEVRLARLPVEFDGLTIAQMSDIHHGPFTSTDYLGRCVEIVNHLRPDLIALTGDFVFGSSRYVEPCAEALRPLRARIGVYAVLGNHDYYHSAGHIARALRRAGINLLVDGRERLEQRGAKLWLMGMDDLWYGQPDLDRVMRDLPESEAKITLAHNPDFIEVFAARGKQVDFILSGHTHGGQVRLPLLGAPYLPSKYGQRYAMGLNHKGPTQIYTTRGIGTVGPPVRFACPPEIVHYTLRRA